jgi:hypothetical protein
MIYISSVMLRSKKLEIRNVMTVKTLKEMEPNPSKDRAMHEGENPSF